MGDDSSYLAGESASNFTHVEASWTQGLGEIGAHSRALGAIGRELRSLHGPSSSGPAMITTIFWTFPTHIGVLVSR
jgi:hypothetical protein